MIYHVNYKLVYPKDSLMLMAHSSTHHNHDVWFLDSGASNHMTGRKNLFTELNEKVQERFLLGTSLKSQSEGEVMY